MHSAPARSLQNLLDEPFICALYKKMMHQGRLYVFSSFVCFYSNVFGIEQRAVVALQSVTAVAKAKTAVVVPNAIDTAYFTPGPLVTDGPAIILILGRVVVRKGVEDIVALTHRLRDLAGQVRFVVIGDGSLWSDYRPLLDDLAPGMAEVISQQGRDEVRERLRGARVLIQASHYEPFGLTVGEALSCGVPTIVTDAVGAGEGLSADVSTCVAVGDVDAIEAAVRAELNLGPLTEQRQESCRAEAIRRYSPAVVGEQALEALRSVATGGRR